jgi:hypothetical protein
MISSKPTSGQHRAHLSELRVIDDPKFASFLTLLGVANASVAIFCLSLSLATACQADF